MVHVGIVVGIGVVRVGLDRHLGHRAACHAQHHALADLDQALVGVPSVERETVIL